MKFINYDLIKKGAFSFILAGSLAGSSIVLSGCTEQAVTTNKVKTEDMMETITDGDETIFRSKEHKIPVKTKYNSENELFKLVVTYYTNEKEWRSTSDRSLGMDIHTEGLDEDRYDIYIDNIHTDTSLISTYLEYDGIKVDSMDDRIHNSVDRGFFISNDKSYIGINNIEGQSDTITEIFTSDSSSTTNTYRVSEEALLKKGVYANSIDSVFGLIIFDKETNETTWIDVQDNIPIPVNKNIEYTDGTIRKYDDDGSYTDEIKVKQL